MAGGRWFAQRAWLGSRLAEDVTIEVSEGRFTALSEGDPAPADAVTLPGLVLPGFANVHSHAFHRVLRGRAERTGGDFWRWRQLMYDVASRLDPDRYRRLARAVFCEMVLSGFTAVGEFHYLHHGADGTPYDEPNAMGLALLSAAEEAGLRITLLDTCYLNGGMNDPSLDPAQRRFAHADVGAWAERATDGADAATSDRAIWGAAVHSVRAVPLHALEPVAAWAGRREAPLHVHVSEQPAENEACLEATGRTPTQLLADRGVLGARTTAVHATHLTAGDVDLLGSTATRACLCPTTEAALADGVGPAASLRSAGSPIALGTDCHASIDPFVEMRALEMHERLTTGARGHHSAEQLLAAGTVDGMGCLGWHDAGRMEVGARADLIAVRLDEPRLAGLADDPVAAVVFAATAADVTDVIVDGRVVVEDGLHRAVADVAHDLDVAIAAVVA